MISKDNKWHVTERKDCEDGGYRIQSASKTLTRMKEYSGGTHNVGTLLLVTEEAGRDYPYSLSIFFRVTPFPIKSVRLPIECNEGDIESACNIADDTYRAYCTEMVKYFTEDCKMLPEI